MNGLKYIRTRCNLSLNELAKILGVSRQILSAWETDKKPIPKKRQEQLSHYFGVDKQYFGTITEREKQYLLEKAMFRYHDNNDRNNDSNGNNSNCSYSCDYNNNSKKESYRYKPQNGIASISETQITFADDGDMTLDETYILAKKRKQTTLDKIDEIIRYYNRGECIKDQIVNINRGCNIYESINALMDEMPNKEIHQRMTYFHTINSTLYALLFAHDLISAESIQEKYRYYKDTPYDDTDWIFHLATQIKGHWELTKHSVEQSHLSYKASIQHQKGKALGSSTPSTSLLNTEEEMKQTEDIEKQIKEIEKEHKKLKKEYPEQLSQSYFRINDK